MDILWKYGPPGLAGLVLRREFIEAAELLRKVSALEQSWPLSAPELMAAMYYLLAHKRGERGNQPDLEAYEHQKARLSWSGHESSPADPVDDHYIQVSSPVPSAGLPPTWNDVNCGGVEVADAEVHCILEVAPFALHFVYGHTAPEMQLRAAQKGFWLLFCNTDSAPEKPAFSVFARPASSSLSSDADGEGGVKGRQSSTRTPQVILSVRGTNDIYDVVTDLRAMPMPFPPISDEAPYNESSHRARRQVELLSHLGSSPSSSSSSSSSSRTTILPPGWVSADGVAHTTAVEGMSRAAIWVADEVEPVLRGLVDDGYEVVLTGHSLGGAVSALLGFLLRQRIPGLCLRCVTFGSPSCMDEELAGQCAEWTTSVVLHDDVIPRITHTSVRDLVKELLRQRECCMGLWHSDLEAVWGRVCGFWSPRWRDSFLRGKNRGDAPYSISAKGLRSPGAGFDGIGVVDSMTTFDSSSSAAVNTAADLVLAQGGNASAHDGSGVHSHVVPATSASKAETALPASPPTPPSSNSMSVADALKQDLEMRNALVGSKLAEMWDSLSAEARKEKEHAWAQVKVGDQVKAWGIVVPTGEKAGNKGGEGRGDSKISSAADESNEDEEMDSNHGDFARDADADGVFSNTLGRSSGTHLSILADNDFGTHQSGWYSATISCAKIDGTYDVSFENDAVRPAVTGSTNSLPAYLVRKIENGDSVPGEHGNEGDDGTGLLQSMTADKGGCEKDQKESLLSKSSGDVCRGRATNVEHGAVDGGAGSDGDENGGGSGGGSGTIMIDDLELPELRIPGRIVHIYSQRGVYLASNLSRDSTLLTKIRMYGNMLSDHSADAYFNALCEVLDVRSAPTAPPEWVPFATSNYCLCCRAEFSWHSTARNLTAKCRDKHNCRCCGKLVCDPCSRNRRTVPRLGLNSAVRVCDRCFYDAAALSQKEGPA